MFANPHRPLCVWRRTDESSRKVYHVVLSSKLIHLISRKKILEILLELSRSMYILPP